MVHKDSHNHIIDKIALVNAISSAVALYPQLYSLLIDPSGTKNFSPISFGLIFVNNIIWTWYGLHRRMIPITISSVLTCIASGAILFLIL